MWNNFEKNIKINGLKLKVVLSIALFVIYFFLIRKMPSPYFTDEIGYWGCAAYFARIDWTNVTSKMAYYGYGYGILLFPLFILGDSEWIYMGAILLNIIFIESVFLILIGILNKMFSKKFELENICCAFIGCLYSAFIVYSHITLSETCILFFGVVLVSIIQKFCENPKIIYGIWMALVLFELIAIHLRNIYFILITLLFLLFLLIKKKQGRRTINLTILFILCAVILALVIKKYITLKVFTDIETNIHIDANDNVKEHLWFLNQLINIEWWKDYFINVLCKSFYLILSSLFIIVFAFIYLFKECRKQKESSEKYFKLFLFFYLICTILYGSLIMFAGGSTFRIDVLLYGRYIEFIMPLFCAIGLRYFIKNKDSPTIIKLYFCVALLVLVISQVAGSYYRDSNISISYGNIMPLQISSFSWMLMNKPTNITQIITSFAVLVYLLIVMFIYIIIKNKRFSLVIIATCWIIFAYIGWWAFGLNLNETIDINALSRVQRMEKIKEVADYLIEAECDEVYYIFDSESKEPDFYDMFTLQFDLVKTKLLPISGDEIISVPKNNIIVINYCSTYYNKINENCKLIYENSLFNVVKVCN